MTVFDSGCDSLHARYYNPNVARFLSVDPGRDNNLKVPQSWNLYAYVRNNPVSNRDPDGRELVPMTGDPLLDAQFLQAIDTIELADPRLKVMVDGLKGSPFVFRVADRGRGNGGTVVADSEENNQNGVGTGGVIYLDFSASDFVSLTTHELSHAEDDRTGTLSYAPTCTGCANVTESKAVRTENLLPQHRGKPLKTYYDRETGRSLKVKNPTVVPPVPKAGSGEKRSVLKTPHSHDPKTK